MFNSMPASMGGPGYPPPMFALPFPPGHSPGAMIAIPARPALPSPTPVKEEDEQAEAAENELLKKILLSLNKISHLVKHNDRMLKDISGRQSAIEDKVSLMEQRIYRIDTRVLELQDQDRDVNENVKRVVLELESVQDEVKKTNGFLADLESPDATKQAIGERLDVGTEKWMAEAANISSELKEMKKSFEEVAETAKLTVGERIDAGTERWAGEAAIITAGIDGVKKNIEEATEASKQVITEQVDAGTKKFLEEAATISSDVKEVKKIIEEAAVKVDKMQGLLPAA